MLRRKERELELRRQGKEATRLVPCKDSDGECFLICEFEIDIGRISVKSLIAMRAVLPSTEYKLLKNRKCARESRKKRKQQITENRHILKIC